MDADEGSSKELVNNDCSEETYNDEIAFVTNEQSSIEVVEHSDNYDEEDEEQLEVDDFDYMISVIGESEKVSIEGPNSSPGFLKAFLSSKSDSGILNKRPFGLNSNTVDHSIDIEANDTPPLSAEDILPADTTTENQSQPSSSPSPAYTTPQSLWSSFFTASLRFFCGVDKLSVTSKHLISPLNDFVATILSWEFAIPYFPFWEKPGWLLYCFESIMPASRWYVKGSSSKMRKIVLTTIFSDIRAGILVAVVLIPQSLGQASLANLPPINGLKSAVFPSIIYLIFGCSMVMNIGSSSTISLLVASLINKYQIDYINDPENAVDFALQASLAVGIILASMSLLNLGYVMRFISVPVFTGYVTGVTFLIGLSQLKHAFGFSCPTPQQGDSDTDWYYQEMAWYATNWNGRYAQSSNEGGHTFRNPYATSIFIGMFISLFFIQRFKAFITTPERKKDPWFIIWLTLLNMAPLAALIFSAIAAHNIRAIDGDYYATTLHIVGDVSAGLDLLHVPSFKYAWSKLFIDVLPLTLLSFYEGFAIARKYAAINHELSFLNATQELWAIGVANIVGSVTSAYPVSGSFTRTAINVDAGAKSPFAAMSCVLVVVLVLGVFGPFMFFIPYSALAALICVSLYNNLGIAEGWEAVVSSNKDALVFFTTFLVTFLLDTAIGLLAGILTSFLIFHYQTIFSIYNTPHAAFIGKETDGVRYIRLNSDLSFLTVSRMKDTFIDELLAHVSLCVIIVDFTDVKHIDLSALKAFQDISLLAKELKVAFVTVNVLERIKLQLNEFGFFSDASPDPTTSRSKKKLLKVENIRDKLQKHQSVKTFMSSSVSEPLSNEPPTFSPQSSRSRGLGRHVSMRRGFSSKKAAAQDSSGAMSDDSEHSKGSSSGKSDAAGKEPRKGFIPFKYMKQKQKSTSSLPFQPV